jgi:hypothetical protein
MAQFQFSACRSGHPECSHFSGGTKDLSLAVTVGDPSRGGSTPRFGMTASSEDKFKLSHYLWENSLDFI